MARVPIGSTVFVQACARMMSAPWIERQMAETSTAPLMSTSGVAYALKHTIASNIGMGFELALKSLVECRAFQRARTAIRRYSDPQVLKGTISWPRAGSTFRVASATRSTTTRPRDSSTTFRMCRPKKCAYFGAGYWPVKSKNPAAHPCARWALCGISIRRRRGCSLGSAPAVSSLSERVANWSTPGFRRLAAMPPTTRWTTSTWDSPT